MHWTYGFPYIKSLRFGLKFVTYHSLGYTDYEKIQQISIPTLFHHQTLAPCCFFQLSVPIGILQARILKWVALLQGLFPTERSNLSFLHCRQILHHLSQQGSPNNIYSQWLYYTQTIDLVCIYLRLNMDSCLLRRKSQISSPFSFSALIHIWSKK